MVRLPLAARRPKTGAKTRAAKIIAVQLDLAELHLHLVHLRQDGVLAAAILLEVSVALRLAGWSIAQ